jgi:hypothetical protein
MNITVLVSHSADTRISGVLSILHEQVVARRLAIFTSIVIDGEPDPEAHLWESEWAHESGTPLRKGLLTGLAELGSIDRLRLVAIGSEVDDERGMHLGRAMEILDRSSRTVIGARTEISAAHIGIVGRQEARPAVRFFSRLADHNLLVLPYDRFDDAAAADAIVATDVNRFAVHGAAEVGALCGLWAPMDRAPVDKSQLGLNPTGELAIRLVQSRIRSLHAPTVSLHELFGERQDCLPVPSRYKDVEKLSTAEINALAGALVSEVEEFKFVATDLEDEEYEQGRLLRNIIRTMRGALKELPGTIRSVVRGELRMVVRVALQDMVAPGGGLRVVDDEYAEETGPDELEGVVADPWSQSRVRESLPEIPGETWTKLVHRILATIGGDPSADDIRKRVLGGADRVPVGRKDLLDGMEHLPGSLPRLALGDDQVTLLGRARAAERSAPSDGRPELMQDELLEALEREWDGFLSIVAQADERVHSSLQDVVPFDWSGNVLTLIHAEGTDARARRRLESAGTRAILIDALQQTVGREPVLFSWITDETEFRRIVIPTSTGAATAAERSDSGKTSRSGVLIRIGELILSEREIAERRLAQVSEDLRVAAKGFGVYDVPPLAYVVMLLGLAGLMFETLTSPLGGLALDLLPEDAGTGALYAPVILSMGFIALLLTNFAMGIGWQMRFVLAVVLYAAVIGAVVLFEITLGRRELLWLHVIIAVLLAIAWLQTRSDEAQLRRMLTRIASAGYVLLIIVILAILQNRGAGPLAQIDDPQTQLRIGQFIRLVSWAAVAGPFILTLWRRVQLRIALQRAQRSSAWMSQEYDRAREAVEVLGLAYVQWNVTACSIAQVLRRPYGPIVAVEVQGDAPKLEGVRRAGFADLKLTTRGTDTLRNRLRQELVPPGWLKRRYEVRVEAFLRLEATRLGLSPGEVRDLRPETDAEVSTLDEVTDRAAARSRRLHFAHLGDRGEFDAESSAPIADEALLELLSPVLRDPDAQRITGAAGNVPTAVAFLSQARPVEPAPQIPLDEVEDFDGQQAPVRRQMRQYVWWPRFLAYPEDASEEPVEETVIRWVGGGPADGSAAVQLLAVRVDVSEPFEYETLRYRAEPQQAADAPAVFLPRSGAGPVG